MSWIEQTSETDFFHLSFSLNGTLQVLNLYLEFHFTGILLIQ